MDHRTRTSRGIMAGPDGRFVQPWIAARRLGAAIARIAGRKGAIAGNVLFTRRTDRRRRPAPRLPRTALRPRRFLRVHARGRSRKVRPGAPWTSRGGTRRRLRNSVEFAGRRVGLPDGSGRALRAPRSAVVPPCSNARACRRGQPEDPYESPASSTGAPSTNRRHSGSAARKIRPYPLVNTRGSRMTTIPVSAAVRISRPNPCFSLMTACGT